MLTETWTDNYTEIEVNSFTCFVLHRTEIKKSSKRNSGGIIVYIRHEYVTNETLLFKDKDDILWVKISGSIFNLDNDFLCVLHIYCLMTLVDKQWWKPIFLIDYQNRYPLLKMLIVMNA